MKEFTKLYNGFWQGSMRDESVETRLLFIAMLSLSEDGTVYGTPSWLASYSNIPIEKVEAALERLSSPDPNSTSPDADGRRIVRLGANRWQIVNWERYYVQAKAEDRREYLRKKQAEHRASTRVNTCQHMSTSVNIGQLESTPEGAGRGTRDDDMVQNECSKPAHIEESMDGDDVQYSKVCDSEQTKEIIFWGDNRGEENKIGGYRGEEKEKGGKKGGVVETRDDPPSEEECGDYAEHLGLPRDEGLKFHAYHSATGWVVGKSKKPMVNWKQGMVTWKRNYVSRGGKLTKTVSIEEAMKYAV